MRDAPDPGGSVPDAGADALGSIATALRAHPPASPTPVAELRARVTRRHHRRRAIAAALVVVVFAGSAVALTARRTDRPTLVTTRPPTTRPLGAAPGPPPSSTLSRRPLGAVRVLAHGPVGSTHWWLLAYAAVLTADDRAHGIRHMSCVDLVDDIGTRAGRGGGCSGSSGPLRTLMSNVEFATIGGHPFVMGEAGLEVDGAEVRLTSGPVLPARIFDLPDRSGRVWVVELPGPATTAEAQATMARVSWIQDGARHTLYPPGFPPDGFTPLPTVGQPVRLTFAGGVQLTVEQSTPDTDGRPRPCTTASVSGTGSGRTGVRECFPAFSPSGSVDWSYFDRLVDRWVLSGSVPAGRSDFRLSIDGRPAQPLEIHEAFGRSFFAVTIPLRRRAQVLTLTWRAGGRMSTPFAMDGVRPGARFAWQVPVNGVVPPFDHL